MQPDLGHIIGVIGVGVMLLEQARTATLPERRGDAVRLRSHTPPA